MAARTCVERTTLPIATQSLPEAPGVDRADIVPAVVHRATGGIDHRQLTPTMVGGRRDECVDRLLGGEAEPQELKAQGAEAWIRAMLGHQRGAS